MTASLPPLGSMVIRLGLLPSFAWMALTISSDNQTNWPRWPSTTQVPAARPAGFLPTNAKTALPTAVASSRRGADSTPVLSREIGGGCSQCVSDALHPSMLSFRGGTGFCPQAGQAVLARQLLKPLPALRRHRPVRPAALSSEKSPQTRPHTAQSIQVEMTLPGGRVVDFVGPRPITRWSPFFS